MREACRMAAKGLACGLAFVAAMTGGTLLSCAFLSNEPLMLRGEVDRIEGSLAVITLISESGREEKTIDLPVSYLASPIDGGDHLVITISSAADSDIKVVGQGKERGMTLLQLGANARAGRLELPWWALPKASAPGSRLQIHIGNDPASRQAAEERVRHLYHRLEP